MLEASGASAVDRARDLWSAAPAVGSAWMLQVGPDIARIGLLGDAAGLCARVGDDLAGLDVSGCPMLAPSSIWWW